VISNRHPKFTLSAIREVQVLSSAPTFLMLSIKTLIVIGSEGGEAGNLSTAALTGFTNIGPSTRKLQDSSWRCRWILQSWGHFTARTGFRFCYEGYADPIPGGTKAMFVAETDDGRKIVVKFTEVCNDVSHPLLAA